jgi:hypothetical protein
VAITGLCDSITGNAGAAGTKLSPGIAQAPTDQFGSAGSAAGTLGALAAGGAVGTSIYVQGNDTGPTVAIGGGPTAVKRWAPGEHHAFTVTIALPDQGVDNAATIAGGNAGNDILTVGRDTVFQGGKVGFDLVWVAVQ